MKECRKRTTWVEGSYSQLFKGECVKVPVNRIFFSFFFHLFSRIYTACKGPLSIKITDTHNLMPPKRDFSFTNFPKLWTLPTFWLTTLSSSACQKSRDVRNTWLYIAIYQKDAFQKKQTLKHSHKKWCFVQISIFFSLWLRWGMCRFRRESNKQTKKQITWALSGRAKRTLWIYINKNVQDSSPLS